jgi:hypothetical protein
VDGFSVAVGLASFKLDDFVADRAYREKATWTEVGVFPYLNHGKSLSELTRMLSPRMKLVCPGFDLEPMG